MNKVKLKIDAISNILYSLKHALNPRRLTIIPPRREPIAVMEAQTTPANVVAFLRQFPSGTIIGAIDFRAGSYNADIVLWTKIAMQSKTTKNVLFLGCSSSDLSSTMGRKQSHTVHIPIKSRITMMYFRSMESASAPPILENKMFGSILNTNINDLAV